MSIVLNEIKKYWKLLIFLVLSVIGMTFGGMALPTLMKRLIDEAIPQKDVGIVFIVTGEMLLFTAIQIVCGILTFRFAATVSMGVGRNLRGAVFEKVQGLSQKEIDAFSTSSLITRTNNDIMQVQTFLSMCLSIAVIAPMMCIIGVALSVSTSPGLSSVLIIAVPLLCIALVIIGKIAIPLSVSLQEKLDTINMVIREKLTGVRVIRAFGTNSFEEEKFDRINTDYTKINKKMQSVTNLLLPIITIILALTAGLVMVVAYVQFAEEGVKYTTGEVMAVIGYVLQILTGVTMMTIVFLLLPRAATSANRAKEVLKSINEIRNPAEPKDNTAMKGYLEFKDVSFTYAGASIPAIKGLSFAAKPGEITAIIGGTGMGKSTIINLIPRLYDVTEGQVLVDGIDVRDYNLDVLRAKIGFVPQKALLFKGTIESNLAFGDAAPTEERIETAVKIAQSYDFVSKKEEGFNSPVAQGGTNFSGGQRQRLCIARAVVRKPEIYVFDDSFSALDFKTDKALREALKQETGDQATTVIVAQRVSTIMDADRIIVVEKGEIAGIGTHHELLKTCEVYQEIVASQMSKEEMEK